MASRPGTRSVDRRTTHAVPLVASQPSSAAWLGGGLTGSAPGSGPTGVARRGQHGVEPAGDQPVAALAGVQPVHAHIRGS